MGLEGPANVGQDGVVRETHVGIDAYPPVRFGQACRAFGETDGAANAHVPVDVGELPGLLGELHMNVAEGELGAAHVADGQVASGRRPGCGVEVDRADAHEAPHENRVRLDAHPRIDLAESVVVGGMRAVRPGASAMDESLPRPERDLERRAQQKVVLGRHVEVERPGLEANVVDLQIDRGIRHREGAEGHVQRPGALWPGVLDRQVHELTVVHDGAQAWPVEFDPVDEQLAGQKSEEPRPDEDARAIQRGGAVIARLDPHAVELHRERPCTQPGRVGGDHSLIAE